MRKKNKKASQKCSHLDYDNNEDCENPAEYMCMCCSNPVCPEHNSCNCEYGGMGFIDIE